MEKYAVLRDLLSRQQGEVEYTFDQLSSIVPGGLPMSAYRRAAWWSDEDPAQVHCRAWEEAGYTAHADLAQRRVRFVPAPVDR